jgi:hypothetical protein
MIVRTTAVINKPPEDVWALLCDSQMDSHTPLLFRFGIPKPVECRLPSGIGGAGQQRQCVSNLGTVNQRITLWEDNKTLMFEMMNTDMSFGRYVTSIKERFDLASVGERQTKITRTTEFKVKGRLGNFKSLLIWIGLKNVHRYVFRNWGRLQIISVSESI